MGDGSMTWERVDELVTWLLAQLGDGLVAAIDDAEAVFGRLRDDERYRVRARHKELPRALASLKRRDRLQPMGLLPAEERRAITLGLFARICADRDVEGWKERLTQVLTADETQYRSTHFEFECASLLAWQGARKVDFVSDNGPGRTCEMRIDDLVDVECKRLQGRSQLDRQTAALWRRLEQRLWKVAALGYEYTFVVDITDRPREADVAWIVKSARELLVEDGATAVQTDDARVRCSFHRLPRTIVGGSIKWEGLPDEVFERYHVQHVDARAKVKGKTILGGVACTFAFRTDQESDMEVRARRVLSKARKQLPKERPSIAFIDAYEPLLDFAPADREPQRRLIYAALERELNKRSHPTGVVLAAPELVDDPVERTFIYTGNGEPSAPFPDSFELFSGWAPAATKTAKGGNEDA